MIDSKLTCRRLAKRPPDAVESAGERPILPSALAFGVGLGFSLDRGMEIAFVDIQRKYLQPLLPASHHDLADITDLCWLRQCFPLRSPQCRVQSPFPPRDEHNIASARQAILTRLFPGDISG